MSNIIYKVITEIVGVSSLTDEFCYKVNRRYMGDFLFYRSLFACALYNYKKFIHES